MLTKTLSKIMPKPNYLGIHLKLEDDDNAVLGAGTHTVIDMDIFESYGEITSELRNDLGRQVQDKINEYKDLKAVATGATYNTIFNWIDTNTSV